MAITASYDPIAFDLDVAGDTAPNTIAVSRTAAGTLLVNGGAVPVSGGPATVANTDLIAVSGDLGNDTISLDETNGALPAAELVGGDGNDALTGGSGMDSLFGEAGDDTLLGRGGIDLLFGGDDNDTLAGGDGDDQMFGGLGNDRLIWNPGDDTDLWEGGDGTDTGEVNGGNGAEVFTITANGTRVRFDRIDPAPFILDIGTTENLVLNANGGDDTISTSGNLAALIALTLDGGAGNDTILGGNGADLLLGGDGNDFIDGNQASDVAFLGAGDDVFQWDPGDGNDVVEGQADADTLRFNASNANESVDLSANGVRALLTRNIGAIVMDVNGVETFAISALGGADVLTIGDLTGTDVTLVAIDLAGTLGGASGDVASDTLTVNGSSGANAVTLTGSGSSYAIAGLAASVAVTNSEGANDALTLNGLGGNDTIDAATLQAGVVGLTIDGGTGDDTILASAGADVLIGGDGNDLVEGNQGNDVAFLGIGDDVFQWDPGDASDIVEGQAGVDELRFNGSNASETVQVAANGGRLLFSRDIAAVVMDLDDVERVRFAALGGADNIVVGDLTGTDAQKIEIDLSLAGVGDGAADTVTVNATNGADAIAVTSPGGVVTVTLPWTVSVSGAEVANDRLVLNAAAGDDVIDASGLAANRVALTVSGGLGADLFIGSNGGETFVGGDGNDVALLGRGNDTFVWNPGDDNDIVEGQLGTDTLQFNGANIAENITISPNGGRVIFFRDIANVTMDIDDTEVIQFAALGGADNILVNDLGGTNVTQVKIDLAGTIGGATGDFAVDTLTFNATGAANTIVLSGTAAALNVTGLPWSVAISQIETADALRINAGAGNDSISTTGIANLLVKLTLDGGDGNDTIQSTGDGTYLGGAGDDLVLAGLTNSSEVIDGGSGIDTLDTRTWDGSYVINLITGATNYLGESFTNFENLITGNGIDTITGTAAGNVIRTNGGNDNVAAGDGDDTVEGGALGDTLDGGVGIDTLAYDSSDAGVTVLLAMGTASGGHATGDSFSGFENLTGSGFGDTLGGDAGANLINGLAGNDTIAGLGGPDTLDGGAGTDRLDYTVSAAGVTVSLAAGSATGGDADGDSFVNFESVLGSEFADALTGNNLDNALFGNAGDDVLTGLGGNDQLNGGTGADLLLGGGGDDVLQGAGGDDRLLGSSGIDSLIGGTGKDILIGGTGADAMAGGAGDDLYYVDDAGDTVTEVVGAGWDIVRAGVDYVLGDNVEELFIGGAARDGTGNALANTLHGSGSSNTLAGLAGDDILRGLGGRDTLLGGDGADLIDGGVGKDTMTGGADRDVFQFRDGDMGPTRPLADLITDFSHADAEKISLSLIDANTTVGGNQAFAWIGTGAFTGAAGQLHYAQQAGTTYVEGDTNGDGTADFAIALTGLLNLVAGDFVL